MNRYLHIDDPVGAALEAGRPVVALETSFVAHGLPWPDNWETVRAMQREISAVGAVPAAIGVVAGRVEIGLSHESLRRFASSPGIAKASRRDISALVAAGADGATTVSGTVACAALAGIEILATGGIGGVHRGAPATFDISADLNELGRTRVAVVCSGAKSILDLPKTLERLESEGVAVVGFGCDTFPAFHARSSGLSLDRVVDTPHEAARIIAVNRDLGRSGIVIAHPVPAADALDREDLDRWTEIAVAAAAKGDVRGKALTPFLLEHIAASSDGRTLRANRSLLASNAALAARIAVALSALDE